MSWNRLPYDICSYEFSLAQSMGPGIYTLSTPANSSTPCHAEDPFIRLQSQGVSISKNTDLIDINSELLGITRNLSNCPSRQFLPNPKVKCASHNKVCVDNTEMYHFKDCFPKTEETKLSNPASTLRCTGWNRWEWLWHDPQENIQVPFDFEINSQIIAKDNHRPCLPKLTDQYRTWPSKSNATQPHPTYTGQTLINPLQSPMQEPSISWQSPNVISKY